MNTSILDLLPTLASDPVVAPLITVMNWDLGLPALAAATQDMITYIQFGTPIIKQRGGKLCPKGTSTVWATISVAATLAHGGDRYSVRLATQQERVALRAAISAALAGELLDNVRRVLATHLEISMAWSPSPVLAPASRADIGRGRLSDRYDPSNGGRDIH